MYKSGDIFIVDFGASENNVQSGYRPAIIVSNNKGNLNSPNVIVIPVTSKIKKMNMPTHIFLKKSQNGLKSDSVALCENLLTVSKKQLIKKVGELSPSDMSNITIGIMLATTSLWYIEKPKRSQFVRYISACGDKLNGVSV